MATEPVCLYIFILLVGCQDTASATAEEQFAAGQQLLKFYERRPFEIHFFGQIFNKLITRLKDINLEKAEPSCWINQFDNFVTL